MTSKNANLLFILTISYCLILQSAFADKDRVLLKDIDVLTLSSDRYTNSRRSSPVKQLQCLGGSAGCSKFTPKVVQCYNRGSDGYDVNWECKADLPSDISFGKLSVSCEGYDNPNDKYVLRGSCGLEYTLDSHKKHSSSQHFTNNDDQQPSGILSFFVFIGIIVIIAVLYFTCIAPNNNVNVGDNHSNYGPSSTPFDSQVRPPPPGFIDPNYPSAPPSYEESQTRNRGNFYKSSTYTATGTQNSNNDSPGFWSGAALGGLAGYFAGRGSSSSSSSAAYSRPYGTSYFSSPTTTQTTSSRQSSSSSDSSMRTASGFATTSRR